MILVTGANGQLGSELRELVIDQPNRFIFCDLDLDITDFNALHLFFSSHEIEFVINCAAYTAVDKAESEKEKATQINAIAPGLLAELSKEFGYKLIHISTEYVFDGLSVLPYREDDATNPLSVYGKTKTDGEIQILNSGVAAIIIRTSWLYSKYGGNFVKTMIRLASTKDQFGVIFDQTGSPTWAHDLAVVILEFIKQIGSGKLVLNDTQIFHFSNEGVASWYDFAKAIVSKSGLNVIINPLRTAEYPTPATRPPNSMLDKQKIKKTLGVTIPYWRDSLEKCLKQLNIKP